MGNFDQEAMRARLRAEVERQGVSLRQVSTRAGVSHGYISLILNEGKEPSVQNLAKVCDGLGVSLAYIALGVDITPSELRLLKILRGSPDKVDSVLALFD